MHKISRKFSGNSNTRAHLLNSEKIPIKQFLIISDLRMQCRSSAPFLNDRLSEEIITMNEICLPASDHAGWWLQGAKSPGCQKTHSEDDGWEGNSIFFSNAKVSNNSWYTKYVPDALYVSRCPDPSWSVTGPSNDLHGARKAGYVTFSWWVCGGSLWSVVSAAGIPITASVYCETCVSVVRGCMAVFLNMKIFFFRVHPLV